MPERRSQERLFDAEIAMISWQQDGTTLMSIGNVNDLSANGMGLIVDAALSVGTPVAITYGEGKLTGRVRHHVPMADGHMVGVEFDECSKASPLHFEPELLISR